MIDKKPTLRVYGAKEHNLKTTLFRPFHTYGEGEAPNRFWPSLVNAAKKGEDFSMSSGEQVRDFSNVDFVASRICELLKIGSIQNNWSVS